MFYGCCKQMFQWRDIRTVKAEVHIYGMKTRDSTIPTRDITPCKKQYISLHDDKNFIKLKLEFHILTLFLSVVNLLTFSLIF